jgi:hypothetical protein
VFVLGVHVAVVKGGLQHSVGSFVSASNVDVVERLWALGDPVGGFGSRGWFSVY